VTISRDGNSITLSWAAIAGAGGYRIESADAPEGEYTTLSYTGDITITLQNQLDEKKFYRVFAIDTLPAK
jgi:hypothetical protein